jgi:hypothetical protein
MTSDADPALYSSVLAPAEEGPEAAGERVAATVERVAPPQRKSRRVIWIVAPVVLALGVAGFLRFWRLDAVGFNSDEAVYTGTAASLAGHTDLQAMFPIFRAHPLFLQIILSFFLHGQVSDWAARAVTALIGVLTVGATYALGRRLYGHRAGVAAALFLAVMPYHVVVSRQVLLDGLMTLLATVVLYAVVRYIESATLTWMLATGALMGACVLAKETSIVLVGGLYAFFTLTPSVRVRIRHVVLGLAVMFAVIIPFPLALSLSGRTSSGQNFLLWQLFRRPNHGTWFYFRVVPPAVGWYTLGAAAVGLLWLYRERTWRERLLLCWVCVPIVFFTLWPVKGFQYLMPLAPVASLLAGRAVAALASISALRRRRLAKPLAALVTIAVAVTMLVPTWPRINPSNSATFLAGTGGLPGGREAGHWIAAHLPADTQLLTIGPSLANVLEIYGGRRVSALSVSPNPANRNPAYSAVVNPDLAMRRGQFDYVVWDSYTANRTATFGNKITALVDKYHGVAVFTFANSVRSKAGATISVPVIRIYRVRPS